jgi:putative nucleotidyltransferase with HDIG domain
MSTTALMDELNKLPIRHGTAVRVLALLDEPDVEMDRLATLIETDIALSARVLRLANSPFFARGGGVASAARGVFLLGLSVVRSLAVTTAAGLFDARAKALPPGFWDHAIACAAGATFAARHLDVDRGDAFSAGLMHDVGEALVRRHAPAEFAEIARQIAVAPGERLAVEQAFLHGLTHADVGAIALAGWGLPDRLVAAIRHHHDAIDATSPALTRAVIAGDAIADVLLEDESPHQAARDLDTCLAAAEIPKDRHQSVLEAVAAETDHLRDALGR